MNPLMTGIFLLTLLDQTKQNYVDEIRKISYSESRIEISLRDLGERYINKDVSQFIQRSWPLYQIIGEKRIMYIWNF